MRFPALLGDSIEIHGPTPEEPYEEERSPEESQEEEEGGAKPDLLVNFGTGSEGMAGDGVYQTTPSGVQVAEGSVTPGETADYQVALQNDGEGEEAQTFVLKAKESSGNGWTACKDGNRDISSQIRGAGYTTTGLVPGASVGIVEVTADDSVSAGEVKEVTITAPAELGKVGDAVMLRTTAGKLVVNTSGDEGDPGLKRRGERCRSVHARNPGHPAGSH